MVGTAFRVLAGSVLAAAALVFAPAAAAKSCAAAILEDWQDGRIDGVYPPSCYRAALESMPEDVRVYSTAQTDIARALQSRLAAKLRTGAEPRSASPGATAASSGPISMPFAVLGGSALLLVAGGSALLVTRRLRR
jgi:hypothetical protein